jgi:hypothetical protein
MKISSIAPAPRGGAMRIRDETISLEAAAHGADRVKA